MIKIRQYLDKIIGGTLMALMGFMVLNVLWQIFSRYVLQNPGSFTDELARYQLIWIGLLGAAYVSGQNMHLSIDLLLTKLSAGNRKKLEIFIRVIIIAFALSVMVAGGIRLVYITLILEQNSPALQIPLGYIYTIIPISGLLIIFYKLADIISLSSKGKEVLLIKN